MFPFMLIKCQRHLKCHVTRPEMKRNQRDQLVCSAVVVIRSFPETPLNSSGRKKKKKKTWSFTHRSFPVLFWLDVNSSIYIFFFFFIFFLSVSSESFSATAPVINWWLAGQILPTKLSNLARIGFQNKHPPIMFDKNLISTSVTFLLKLP